MRDRLRSAPGRRRRVESDVGQRLRAHDHRRGREGDPQGQGRSASSVERRQNPRQRRQSARRRNQILVLLAQQRVDIELFGLDIRGQMRERAHFEPRRSARLERALVRAEAQNKVFHRRAAEVGVKRARNAPRRRRPRIRQRREAGNGSGAGISQVEAGIGRAPPESEGAVENAARQALGRINLEFERQC